MIPRIRKKAENKSSTREANKYTVEVESNITNDLFCEDMSRLVKSIRLEKSRLLGLNLQKRWLLLRRLTPSIRLCFMDFFQQYQIPNLLY
jgi:hypothetical protein